MGQSRALFSVAQAEVPPPFDWTLDFYFYLFFANLQNTAKILVPQIANPQIATLAEAPRKYIKFCKSANLRICTLRNLFVDRPHFLFYKSNELTV
jgi:hypothetical protein